MSVSALRPALAALLLSTCLGAQANEDAVKKGVETFIGAPAVESVARTPYGSLYEVVLKSGELLYTDEAVSFLIDGRVIDTKTRQDITGARQAQLSAIDFGTLPLDQAIKQVRGSGKRVLVTFEDPNCGYCKRLNKDMVQLKDITIYTFLYPILSQDSHDKARNIWCAKDKAKAWNDWVLDAKVPPAEKCDSTVVDSNVTLGRKLRINGTPTMFLADGSRIGGYLPVPELEKRLGGVVAATGK